MFIRAVSGRVDWAMGSPDRMVSTLTQIIAGKCRVQKQSFVCVQMPNTTLKNSHLGL